ncbi:MAG: hypothetical protein IPI82_16380 [Candidatus Microthrix sp.]|nr:hypothetical protein [Candidatus Microthrix sp.]MBK7323965.1 hypothetical protein [Candidatus Microthrix sp.]
MTDPGNPTAQQRRLAELQARRPKAKRRHPARASRIAVLGLSTTAMFGIVAKLGVDASSQTVATTGTPSAQAATVPAGKPATLTDQPPTGRSRPPSTPSWRTPRWSPLPPSG